MVDETLNNEEVIENGEEVLENNEETPAENDEEIVDEPVEEQPIEQVLGVIYYDAISEDGMIMQSTESTAQAYKRGWLDNCLPIEDIARSADGHYYLKDKVPVKDLEKYKNMKLVELHEIAHKFEENECPDMVFMSSLGYPADGDRRSVQNVANLILVGEPTEYKFGDNSIHPCSVDDLKVLQVEMAKNGNNLYRQKFQMQYEISQLKTVEEVENYQIRFDMMDFSE